MVKVDLKPAIVRRSLHGEVIELLRDMIIEGELKPGEKIIEQELSQRFGVSRTPLREALKVLASEGLVVLAPNRGASVARITQQEIDELFPIMGALEALAGELAVKNITEQALARFRGLHNKMISYYERRDSRRYSAINRAIHEAIFEVAGNATLSSLYQTMIVRTHAVRFIAKKSMKRWKEAVEDHNKMMDALLARDGSALAETLKNHLRHKAETVYETLDAG